MGLSDTLFEIERELSAYVSDAAAGVAQSLDAATKSWIEDQLCSIVAMRLRMDAPVFTSFAGNQLYKSLEDGDWQRYARMIEQLCRDHDLEYLSLYETREIRQARYFVDENPDT